MSKNLFNMGMIDGIKICEEVLRRLERKSVIEIRLRLAFDEITVFQMEDASPEHVKLRDELFQRYATISHLSGGPWRS